MSYAFVPIDANDERQIPTAAERYSTDQPLELIILSDSPNCPDVSLRHADGHYHTGDLFIEVEAGKYLFRGRSDDWIIAKTSGKCDTK